MRIRGNGLGGPWCEQGCAIGRRHQHSRHRESVVFVTEVVVSGEAGWLVSVTTVVNPLDVLTLALQQSAAMIRHRGETMAVRPTCSDGVRTGELES